MGKSSKAVCIEGMLSQFGESSPSGAKARLYSGLLMYGLKPVPFKSAHFHWRCAVAVPVQWKT